MSKEEIPQTPEPCQIEGCKNFRMGHYKDQYNANAYSPFCYSCVQKIRIQQWYKRLIEEIIDKKLGPRNTEPRWWEECGHLAKGRAMGDNPGKEMHEERSGAGIGSRVAGMLRRLCRTRHG